MEIKTARGMASKISIEDVPGVTGIVAMRYDPGFARVMGGRDAGKHFPIRPCAFGHFCCPQALSWRYFSNIFKILDLLLVDSQTNVNKNFEINLRFLLG